MSFQSYFHLRVIFRKQYRLKSPIWVYVKKISLMYFVILIVYNYEIIYTKFYNERWIGKFEKWYPEDLGDIFEKLETSCAFPGKATVADEIQMMQLPLLIGEDNTFFLLYLLSACTTKWAVSVSCLPFPTGVSNEENVSLLRKGTVGGDYVTYKIEFSSFSIMDWKFKISGNREFENCEM